MLCFFLLLLWSREKGKPKRTKKERKKKKRDFGYTKEMFQRNKPLKPGFFWSGTEKKMNDRLSMCVCVCFLFMSFQAITLVVISTKRTLAHTQFQLKMSHRATFHTFIISVFVQAFPLGSTPFSFSIFSRSFKHLSEIFIYHPNLSPFAQFPWLNPFFR